MIGGAGADILVGRIGRDILWGGNPTAADSTKDIFVADNRPEYLSDIVNDFDVRVDKIQLWPKDSSSSFPNRIGVRNTSIGGSQGAEIFVLANNRPIIFLEDVAAAEINSVGGLSAITSTLS